MSALLRIEGLSKHYGTRQILTIAALELHAGESYVLTGDNGSGKTTLLRILAGLEKADGAAYSYQGKPIRMAHFPRRLRHDIIYVHQHPYLFHTSIADNIRYGLKFRHVSGRERERRITEAMRWAGVTHLTEVPPQKLSAGEKQRVALARAKVLEPRILLCDEPTANLDAEARRQVIALLEQVVSASNCVVVACHDNEIIALPHVVRLHLAGGRLDEGGSRTRGRLTSELARRASAALRSDTAPS